MDSRRIFALLAITVLALAIAGCGGGDDSSGDDGGDSKAATSESGGGGDDSSDSGGGEAPPVDTVATPEQRTGGVSTFALTPAIQTCMKQAGFTQDAPPTAAAAAWRHPSGARVVVAASDQESVLKGIADEIGSGEAQIEGTIVTTGAEAPRTAALACLQ